MLSLHQERGPERERTYSRLHREAGVHVSGERREGVGRAHGRGGNCSQDCMGWEMLGFDYDWWGLGGIRRGYQVRGDFPCSAKLKAPPPTSV